MKKAVSLMLLFILSVLLASCSFVVKENEVLASVGEYSEIMYHSHGVFQDFTDYAKYQLKNPMSDDNAYFEKLDGDAKKALLLHLDDFEGWVELHGEKFPYDFDRSIITDDDYLYIYDHEKYPEFGNYDIWFLDSETNILYFFHNNI